MGKIVDRDTLQEIVASAHVHGEKIVFTNGCFDIIHSGHIKYLRQAKDIFNTIGSLELSKIINNSIDNIKNNQD